ncbi:patatin-like phospholipase family protein [Bradyrhizobium sp. AUGA SZCCT0222]|uniref:patatin-like phospholipase family protein n=1 Tax=Bradyrhizobium sp. AUGA SZCCT0222 TaxID=2807668 RepID=UPI001BACAD65|nr:patatin-like phospholipase family protein [Bradyrhizobium sp. AUGA SZCCT0222]MBR1271455.1 patatin-like phospholipase family protein [Bradyrhizobium sp. AUGA SZCCT0222]
MGQVAKDTVEIGVVLQGGGALGAYEFGAMIALLELMDAIEVRGRTLRLVAVTGVSIGAINAACVVGAKDRADARKRLRSLWSELALETPKHWWAAAGRNLALFGVPGFYSPRRDVWNFFNWTNFYDTNPMLGTLKKHVDFDSLNSSPTAFVVTAVNLSSGELIRFRNHPHKTEAKTEIGPLHVLASGSLPPGFPATAVNDASFWDGGVVDNTPLGDAIHAFSGSADVDRILIVMNLFRKNRAAPTNMIEVNDRLAELRYGNRLRQDGVNARTINMLLRIIDDLAAAVPEGQLDQKLKDRVLDAGRFKVLDEITDIDLTDPALMAEAGLPLSSEESGSFRDFSAAGIKRRHDIGYKLAQLKLQKLFEAHGLLPASH